MTEEEVLAGILRREGGFRHVPGDRGGATNFGITQETLGRWRKLGRPATPEEVRALPKEEAEAIYYAQYMAPFAGVPHLALREQLIDFGVNSGVERAIRYLQRTLGIPATGELGLNTLSVLKAASGQVIGGRPALELVNDALVAGRSWMVDRTADAGKMPKSDEEGVESRALGFFLATPKEGG